MRLLVILFGLFWQSNAVAQQIITSEFELYDQSSGGEATICGLEFTFVFKDTVAKQGEVGGVHGSISFANGGGTLMTMFKVGAVSGGKVTTVASATLKSGADFLKPTKQIQCEQPNAFCAGYWGNDSLKVMQGLFDDRMEVRYNLKKGDLDYAFPVSIRKAKNYARYPEFSSCMETVLKSIPH